MDRLSSGGATDDELRIEIDYHFYLSPYLFIMGGGAKDVQLPSQLEGEIKQFIFGNYKDVEISDAQMAMALKLCQEYNLSPLRREIHFLKFWNNGRYDLQPVIAYTEYLKHAQMTKKLNGRSTEVGIREGTPNLKKDMRCTITIHRKDWEHPLKWTVWFSEVAQKNKDGVLNANWNNKPDFMIKKVAIAQGMRLAFPEDLGAMPFEESEAWNTEKEVKQEEKPVIEDKTAVNDDTRTTPTIELPVEKLPLPDANSDPKVAKLREVVGINKKPITNSSHTIDDIVNSDDTSPAVKEPNDELPF